jgi:hypothetical protein
LGSSLTKDGVALVARRRWSASGGRGPRSRDPQRQASPAIARRRGFQGRSRFNSNEENTTVQTSEICISLLVSYFSEVSEGPAAGLGVGLTHIEISQSSGHWKECCAMAYVPLDTPSHAVWEGPVLERFRHA